MANIVLVEPAPTAPPIKFTYKAYVPLAVLTVAAPLVEQGYSVKIIDQRLDANWEKNLLDSIDEDTLCVGVTSMTGRQLLYALMASEAVKRNTSVPVVWGGIHASLLPRQTLENENIDYVVQGEGEETFLALVRRLEARKGPFDIDGLWYKANGDIRANRPKGFLDLNKLPRIPFDLLDARHYDLDDTVPIFTSRGCAHRCGFCYNLQYCDRRWRAMTAERVIEDLKFYVSTYSPNKIVFRDDNFFQDLKRSRRICEGIIAEGLKFRWRASCRIDYIKRMTDSDFRLLVDSGFEDFGFGMESGSQKMLDIMKKDITAEETLYATKRLSEQSLLYSGSFVGGYPGETREDLHETMDFIAKIFRRDPSFTFVLFPYVPYPGTDAHDILVQHGFHFPERIEKWATFHFPHDTAVTGIGKENSFYSQPTPWLSSIHKEELFNADALCQVAGRPFFRGSSPWERLLASPYNLVIRWARYRWENKLLGPVPEAPLLDFIRTVGLYAYRKIKGAFPKR